MKKTILLLVFLSAVRLSAQEQPLIVRMVRHGQPGVQGTDFTPADRKEWIVLGLTPLGRRQAEVTGRFLKKEGIQWAKVIASPQERASETADIICGIIGKTFTLAPDIREAGNPIRETLPGLRKRFRRIAPEENMTLTPAQSRGFKENGKACGLRGRKFILNLVKSKVRGPILLITHGHFMYTTIREMTGKLANPWNCGMSELKVWPDGRAELVKAVYPEVLLPDQITCNQTYFHMDPWFVKFIPYPGPRPEPLALVNGEFQKLLQGGKSSWKRIKGTSAGNAFVRDGKITLRSQRKQIGFCAPRIPLKAGREYHCVVKAGGRGTGIFRFDRRPYKMEMKLENEMRDYEFKFTPKRGETFFQACLEAAPESEMIIAGFLLENGK